MSKPMVSTRGNSIQHTYDNAAFSISYPVNENVDDSCCVPVSDDTLRTRSCKQGTGARYLGKSIPQNDTDYRYAHNLHNNSTLDVHERPCKGAKKLNVPELKLSTSMSQDTPFLGLKGTEGREKGTDSIKEIPLKSKEDVISDVKKTGAGPGPAERETWGKKVDFLLSVIGFAVDLGNVWRFPYICYKNGGGAFLIPYVIMLVFLGMPLFYMELALGQFQRSGAISVWKNICPMFAGVGYGICFVATFVGMYYNTVIAWSVYYLFMSFRAEVPWAHCGNQWNTEHCVSVVDGYNQSEVTNQTMLAASEYYLFKVLEIQKSNGIEYVGAPKWDLLLCLLAVFVIVYFCLWKGIKSSGKAVWITATLPYIVLLILLVRGCTLPGAKEGILYYLRPQWHRLKDVNVWLDAAAQIFFSLGPGFGTLLALASYNKFNNNCYFDAVVTSVINCFTSFLAGFVVFSVLGYMAQLQGRDIDKVAVEGPGLVFVVYPEAIASLDGSIFWSIIFFLMLITLGLDSTFGGLEAVITAICDNFAMMKRRRELFVLALVIYCFLGGIASTTYGGQYIINLLDRHAAPISLLFICFIEAIAVNWFYGVQRFSNDIEKMLGFQPGIFWKICWAVICPICLFLLFILSIWAYDGISLDGYDYPGWSLAVGWCVTCSSLICIPIYVVYKCHVTHGSLKQRIIRMIKPSQLPNHMVGNGHIGHDTYDIASNEAMITTTPNTQTNYLTSVPYLTSVHVNGNKSNLESTDIY